MGFVKLGQEWHTWAPKGAPKEAAQHLRVGELAWLEENEGESGLCPVGQCVTIEEAIRLNDSHGKKLNGADLRRKRWIAIAKRLGLPVPGASVAKGPGSAQRKAKRAKVA